jgi:NADH-quinone oxidoreductase subunit E
MAGRDAESSGLFWSAISVGAALVAALVVGFLVAMVTGGPAAGLTVAGVVFVVLGYVLSYYVLTPERRKPAVAHAAPAAAHAPAAAAPVTPLSEPAPAPPPGTGISERVREAARAAGEAARAAAGEAARAPATGAPGRPASLPAPREGGPDDLKKIKGVGPKLEELLNGLGYYHFDQIAAWTPSEVAWVDSNLEGFNGRATRDDWVGQAKVLAGGGATEFSQRVDRGEVY